MKFIISVTATATTTYEVEIEASSESAAEDIACSREIFNAKSDGDFQIDAKSCSFETEAIQLTHDCERCGDEYPLPTDDTEWCSCAAISTRHIVVDGTHITPPWGLEDQYHCASCDLIVTDEINAERNQSL